jgi:prevent-host-death family protein
LVKLNREMDKFVGVYEANAELSNLLRLVEDGQRVVITKRGKPVADLVPHVQKVRPKFGASSLGFTKAEMGELTKLLDEPLEFGEADWY